MCSGSCRLAGSHSLAQAAKEMQGRAAAVGMYKRISQRKTLLPKIAHASCPTHLPRQLQAFAAQDMTTNDEENGYHRKDCSRRI
jgi:hypothetical protein